MANRYNNMSLLRRQESIHIECNRVSALPAGRQPGMRKTHLPNHHESADNNTDGCYTPALLLGPLPNLFRAFLYLTRHSRRHNSIGRRRPLSKPRTSVSGFFYPRRAPCPRNYCHGHGPREHVPPPPSAVSGGAARRVRDYSAK